MVGFQLACQEYEKLGNAADERLGADNSVASIEKLMRLRRTVACISTGDNRHFCNPKAMEAFEEKARMHISDYQQLYVSQAKDGLESQFNILAKVAGAGVADASGGVSWASGVGKKSQMQFPKFRDTVQDTLAKLEPDDLIKKIQKCDEAACEIESFPMLAVWM